MARLRRPTPAVLCLVVLLLLVFRQLARTVPDPLQGVIPADWVTEQVQVVRAIDGDTVLLSDGRRVRLRAINAPELATDNEPAQVGAEEAHRWLQNLLEHQQVQLHRDLRDRDPWGRTPGWLTLPDGRLINEMALAEGHAVLVTRFGVPDSLSAQLHRAAARTAVRRKYEPRPGAGPPEPAPERGLVNESH